MKIARLGWLAYGLAALVIAADQWVKHYLIGPFHLADKDSVEILPFFHLTAVANHGVSLGMLQAGDGFGRWALAVFSAVAALALAVWAARLTRLTSAVAIGLILGGAVGNLVDRVRLGAVVDFLDFRGLGFPWIFNLADSAITVGVILLMINSLLTPASPPSAPTTTVKS